jgi:hypothetical protein
MTLNCHNNLKKEVLSLPTILEWEHWSRRGLKIYPCIFTEPVRTGVRTWTQAVWVLSLCCYAVCYSCPSRLLLQTLKGTSTRYIPQRSPGRQVSSPEPKLPRLWVLKPIWGLMAETSPCSHHHTSQRGRVWSLPPVLNAFPEPHKYPRRGRPSWSPLTRRPRGWNGTSLASVVVWHRRTWEVFWW